MICDCRVYELTCTTDTGDTLQTTIVDNQDGNVPNITHTFNETDGVHPDTAYTCYVTLSVGGKTSGHSPPVRIKTLFVAGKLSYLVCNGFWTGPTQLDFRGLLFCEILPISYFGRIFHKMTPKSRFCGAFRILIYRFRDSFIGWLFCEIPL